MNAKFTKKLYLVLSLTTLCACNNAGFKGYNGGTSKEQPKSSPTTTQSTPVPAVQTTPSNPDNDILPPTIGRGIDLSWGGIKKRWHIGDGEFDGTSCKLFMTLKPLRGLAFNFNFYVQQDGTSLGISLVHCGIDSQFANKNKVALLGPTASQTTFGGEFAFIMLPASERALFSKTASFPSRYVLNRGWYKIRVESSADNPLMAGDKDDFIVGSVKILTPSNTVELGDVTQN